MRLWAYLDDQHFELLVEDELDFPLFGEALGAVGDLDEGVDAEEASDLDEDFEHLGLVSPDDLGLVVVQTHLHWQRRLKQVRTLKGVVLPLLLHRTLH